MIRRALLEDFERQAFFNFHARGAQNRANGFGRAALAANHFAEIGRIDAQFEDRHLFAFDRPYLNLIGMT